MKAVLLLDSSLASCEQVQHNSDEAIIVALRLLSYLYRNSESDNTVPHSPSPKRKRTSSLSQTSTSKSLRNEDHVSKKIDFNWGFKIFSSTGSIMRTKCSNKTSSLTQTWNQDSFRSFQTNVDAVFKNEHCTNNKRNSLTHPSERLATALTEILHDFEWRDKNDHLKSPARSLRIRKRNRVEEEECHKDRKNMLFIFAKAPSSRQCLRRFSNKVVIDSDVFIDSFMSPALLEEYKEKSQINVYWIDFGNVQDSALDQDTRHESLHIMTESLKKLGGNLLHKCDILKSFPFNESVPSFTGFSPLIVSLPSEAGLLQGLSLPDGGDPDVHIVDGSINVRGPCQIELKGAKLAAFLSINNGVPGESISCETPTSLPKRKMLDCRGNPNVVDVCIHLQGCMSTSAAAEILSSLQMQQSTVLTCDSDSQISILLKMLIRTQNLGILKLSPQCDEVCNGMAILTALTSTCGHIFHISLNQYLAVEKAFFFDRISVKDSCPPALANPFNSHVINSWHKPGSSKKLAHLVGDLKNRPNSQSSSKSANEMLAKLKVLYLKNTQKLQQKSSPVSSTPASARDSSMLSKAEGSAESETGSGSSQAQVRRLSRRSSSSLSRGRLLVERARSASILLAGEEECSNLSTSRLAPSPAGRRTSGSAGFESLNIQSEDELLDYLNKQYSQVLSAGVAMEASIQAMLTVTCYFMSSKEMATNPQKSAIAFIREHLAQDTVKLKEKYGKSKCEDKNLQAVEYKLQVMLLLEMASFVPDNEEFQGERILNTLVSMLRVLSFVTGPTSVREFMANATDSYSGTLPRILMDVYDELDLPYPAALARLSSPSAPSTVWGANMSVGSLDSFHSGPGSSQPPSSGQRLSQGTRRALKQHPSLTDFRQKKQILVEKPKSMPVSKTEGKKSAKDKSKQKVKSTKNRSGADLGRAKRNLFSEKSKSKKANDRLQLTPKRKSGKPKLLVPGTPAHKQTSDRILSRQKRLRDHFNIKPEVQVVAESPVKDDDPHSKVENKPARFLLRESFYSSNSQCQSRIVAKSMEMEEKGRRPAASPRRFLHQSRSHGSLISAVRGESPILSPRSRMIKSFMASPSSEAKPNRKKVTSPPASTSTPHSHLPRRSPRKSVKKLLFASCNASNSQDLQKEQGRKIQNSLDARLVFDGENASDVLPTMSPVKNCRTSNVFELKTPEKRNQSPRFNMWETTSCPPFQVTPTKIHPRKVSKTPELSFRNVFSKAPNKSPGLKFIGNSPKKSLHEIHGSPSKFDNSQQSSRNVSSGAKGGLKKSKSDSIRLDKADKDFVNLKKRVSPQKVARKGSSLAKTLSSSLLRIPDVKGNPSRCGHSSNSSRFETFDADDDEVVFSTPKKSMYNSNSIHSSFHTTPNKVTFSDSFLISPPTGSGHPVLLTPSRSILKGSPSFKNQSFVRRIDLADLESRKLPDASFVSPNHKRTLAVCSPNKMSRSFNIKESSSSSLTQDKNTNCHLTITSPTKQSGLKIASNVKKFDDDSSSSSCESSSVNTITAPPSTVVTAHTPSPSNKCRTPDSINKWMRKKRTSSSRTVSSSSSSSVSPTSSSEFKEKVTGREDRSTIVENVKEESCITDEKKLKRNLFSVDSASPFNTSSPKKRGNGTGTTSSLADNVLSTNSMEEKEMVMKGKGKGKGKNRKTTLFSHTSEGFSHSGEGKAQPCNESDSNVDKRLTMEEYPSYSTTPSSSTRTRTSSYTCFSPVCSPSKKKNLSQQSSSFMGEGSQGFVFNPENPNNSGTPSTSTTLQIPHARSDAAEDTDTLSVDINKCPSDSKLTPGKKQQYSPALSTSGLLQLIRSPLLDDAKSDKAKNREKRSSAKSRKHLDWPL